jgi:hypothetical protein
MRRRNVGKDRDDDGPKVSALESLKAFDVYAKVHEDYTSQSQAGGVVTVITSFIVALLFWAEINAFFTREIVDSITVDTRINQKLPIGLNVTFPHLRCDEVSVDTVDSAGDNQVNVHGGLHKLSLDSKGQVTDDEGAKPGACLSCMEAADEQHKCCNTCKELKDAFVEKDLDTDTIKKTAPQCTINVGCRVAGTVTVNKVSGNVHVALGKSTIRDGKHVHEFNMNDVSEGFNTSHQIDSIRFGDRVQFPGIGIISPLDGVSRIVKHGDFMFHYYIKLVPTVFIDQTGKEQYTNQYSATDSARNVRVKTGELSGLPGVFFVYDFSPFLMRKTERVKPWSYIFTSFCAIIGGVLQIAGLVETVTNAIATQKRGAASVCGASSRPSASDKGY